MIKIYGKGETVSSSEYWDGRTKYNLLQKFIQGNYKSYEDLIDPIKEILSQNFEVFDFLERLTNTTVSKNGIFTNSLQSECILSETDVTTVLLGDIEKTYVRLPPGIISYNKNIQIHKPATELGASQLEQFFELSQFNKEKVEIKYSYETDSFKCRIFKQENRQSPIRTTEFVLDGSWDDDSSVGYVHSADLLSDMYNHEDFRDKIIASIGDNLSKVNLEMLVELESDGIFYWVMTPDGLIELTQDATNKFIINQFTNTNGVVSNIDNSHLVYSSLGETEMNEEGMVIFNSQDGIKMVDDSGSEISIEQNGDVKLSNGNVSVLLKDGNVVVSGNLDVQGVKTEVSTQDLLISDNIIEVNKDLANAPMAGFQSGMRINRGSEEDYYLLFDEDSMSFKIGTLLGLQKVAAREDSPNNTSIPFWNNSTNKLETTNLLVWNGSKIISDVDRIDGLHANDNPITDDDTTLLTKNKGKLYIDDNDTIIKDDLSAHKQTVTNPHNVTKSQVGLGNVPNWNASTNVNLGLSDATFSSQKSVKTYVDNKNTIIQNDVDTKEQESKDRDDDLQSTINTKEQESKDRDDDLQSTINTKEQESKDRDDTLQSGLDTKSDSTHTHTPNTWNEVSGKPTTFTPNGQYKESVGSGLNIAVGWYTIATNSGSRAVARFGVRDIRSGQHQSVIFYAAHHYGTDCSNVLTVLHNSHFSGSPVGYIRIKEAGTWGGAALQIYIDSSLNELTAYLLGDNIQSSGWVLCDWVPDATTPPLVTNYASFTPKSQIHLDLIQQGGIATTGPVYSGGDLEQYRNLTTMDRKFGSGILNSSIGIEIIHGLGRVPSNVQVTITSNPGGYLGEVWTTKDDTHIRVYCSGSTTTTAFDWMVL